MAEEIIDIRRVNVPLEANFLTSTIRGQWAFCADTKRVLGHNLLQDATADFGISDDSLQLLISGAQDVLGAKTFKVAPILFNGTKLTLRDSGNYLHHDGSNVVLAAADGGRVELWTDSNGSVYLSPNSFVSFEAGATENTSTKPLLISGTNQLYFSNTSTGSYIQEDGNGLLLWTKLTKDMDFQVDNTSYMTLKSEANDIIHLNVDSRVIDQKTMYFGDVLETYGGRIFANGTDFKLHSITNDIIVSASGAVVLDGGGYYYGSPKTAAYMYYATGDFVIEHQEVNKDITLITSGSGVIEFYPGGVQTLSVDDGEILIYNTKLTFSGALTPSIIKGTGTPEGSETADIGSIYLRDDGGAGTSFYVKETGVGNTGWVGK